eukprot:TRINITY_DN6599_c0_g1_i1.p1 TRINITY_DN6599_c0_g1~~TRINITY_DN6599_c0_g1_i1.p1  ORF type:complete len:325 (+),score=67.51 TRINITY_DN6599_c0_g1_i1:359-1333(+)
MEVKDIGVVLSRASELRHKVSECITKDRSELEYAGDVDAEEFDSDEEVPKSSGTNSRAHSKVTENSETQSLIYIRNALESLEIQLSSLQTLQQQQHLEREAALADLDESRRDLIQKLKGYRGRKLDIIQEACAFAFAGEPSEQMDDIILPPYGKHPPEAFITSVHDYSLLLHSQHSAKMNTIAHQSSKDVSERLEAGNQHIIETDIKECPETNCDNAPRRSNFLGPMVRWTTKAVLVIATLASVYTLASFELKLNKIGTSVKLPSLLSRKSNSFLLPKKEITGRCPPGKVMLFEEGTPKCFVKERVEVPFEPLVKDPDISYGYG